MKFLVLNGPNLNLLGLREPEIYGRQTYNDLVVMLEDAARRLNVEIEIKQSNHEGDLVDWIQQACGQCAGIVINPAAYTHTSVALLDALKAVALPTVEVHISDVAAREDFRQVSYVRAACVKTIAGHGFAGYVEALEFLVNSHSSSQGES